MTGNVPDYILWTGACGGIVFQSGLPLLSEMSADTSAFISWHKMKGVSVRQESIPAKMMVFRGELCKVSHTPLAGVARAL